MKLFNWIRSIFNTNTRTDKFWYLEHDDGSIEGGLIHFGDIWYVASRRVSAGKTHFQIVKR